MASWLVRPGWLLASWCLVVVLIGAGTLAARAQSTMDPNLDSDFDGTNNAMDFDDDNDGYADNLDCAPFDPQHWNDCTATDPEPDPGTSQEADSDNDGIPDRADPDDDNDGVVDEQDAAPFDPSIGADPPPDIIDHEADSDNDGIANSHDPDDDNDGVPDDEDSHPFDPTRGQKPPPSSIDPNTDSDGDGIANSHDPDDDNDGLIDERDCAPFDAAITTCPVATGGDPGGESPGQGGTSGVASSGAGGGGPVVTSLPVTGTGWPAPVVSPLNALVITVALLGIAGFRGWIHPAPVPARRR